jgi:cytoplasmic iron level regulating protein YaaA (DUF328/UPF0246 family)
VLLPVSLYSEQHKAMVSEANKGKTMVKIYKQDIDEKVNSFIKDNHIMELKTDPTQKNAKNNSKYYKTM